MYFLIFFALRFLKNYFFWINYKNYVSIINCYFLFQQLSIVNILECRNIIFLISIFIL